MFYVIIETAKGTTQNKERKNMNQKALQILEYDKIISQLEDYATSALGKALCRSLLPSSELEKVRQDQQETIGRAHV